MAILCAIIANDLRLAWRRGADTLTTVGFFVLAALVTWLRGRDFARPAQQVFG